MSSDSRDNTPGTLIVAVPHWAATVRVFDNSYKPVATQSSPVDVGQGKFQVTMDLAPGVYRVEAALGASADSEWVSIRSGKPTTIPVERWSTLQLASAAPLSSPAEAASKGPGIYAQKANQWSRTITWTAPQPGQARLFIFIQTPDPQKYPDFSRGLTLLDRSHHPLTTLGGTAVQTNPTEGWLAFTSDLREDFYVLARNGPEPFVYNLPLYLSDRWETHVFMAGGKGPSFRSVTMNMAPLGHGFRYDDDTASAAEAVLAVLRGESGVSRVLASSHLNLLLRREQKNPWLAVLAAYALTAAEAEAREPKAANQAAAQLADPTLKGDVVQFLRQTIGSHPDVRALGLELNVPSPAPFEFPPLMRVGLQRVQQHSTKFVDTIPIGSLTDRLLASQVTTSPWSVWIQADASATASADAPQKKRAQRSRGVAAQTLRASLGPSAPIFQAPLGSPTSATVEENLRRVVYDLPLIKKAQELIGSSVDIIPDKITFRPKEEASKLLHEIDPSVFSAAAGIPLGRAEQALGTLRGTPQAGLGKAVADPTERAILEYALRKGTSAVQSEQDPMAQTKQAGTPSPGKARGPSLETVVVALRDAAEQLLASADDPQDDPSIDAHSKALADRLRQVAKQLLRHADLIAITRPNGEFQYGNGAFTLLMSLIDPADPLRACRKWSRWLSKLPPGRSSHQSPEGDKSDRRFTIRRVAVEDQETAKTTAFVNILDDEKVTRLPTPVFDEGVAAASDVTLHASFVQYGSPKRKVASLDRLEGIVNRLEQSLLGEHIA